MFQEVLAVKHEMYKRFKLESLNKELKGTRVVLQEIEDKKEEQEYSDIEESCEVAEIPNLKVSIVPSSELNRSYFRNTRIRDSSSSIFTVHCSPKTTDKMVEYCKTRNNSRKTLSKSILVNKVNILVHLYITI
jgi:alanyl-tRNA synthetase